MKEFLVGAAILCLSGMGFITYKHPKLGRKIIGVVGGLYVLFSIAEISYFNGYADGLLEAKINPTDKLLTETVIIIKNYRDFVVVIGVIMIVFLLLSVAFEDEKVNQKINY